MITTKNYLRKYINKKNQKKLVNRNFSVISSNCNGACICHDLNMRFNSPFVNLWMQPKDFIRYLQNIEHYINCEMEFIDEKNILYPVGKLDDIKIYFQHYQTEEEAKNKWYERQKRLNLENCFILFSDRDGCSYEDLLEFDKLPFKNKIVFCHKSYPEIQSAYYIKGFENEKSVGLCMMYKSLFSLHKYYDDFDYVAWFNGTLAQKLSF